MLDNAKQGPKIQKIGKLELGFESRITTSNRDCVFSFLTFSSEKPRAFCTKLQALFPATNLYPDIVEVWFKDSSCPSF
jgi:hypothetical protein